MNKILLKGILLAPILAFGEICSSPIEQVSAAQKMVNKAEGSYIAPIYRDGGNVEVNLTTSESEATWNCESFSQVWPQTRNELVDLISTLKENKNVHWHNLHIFAILDLDNETKFQKNVNILQEVIKVNKVLEVSFVISLAIGDKYFTIEPSYIGPDPSLLIVLNDRITYIDEEQNLVDSISVKDFSTIHLNKIKRKNKPYYKILWEPSITNVHNIVFLLEVLKDTNSQYSFIFRFRGFQNQVRQLG